MIEMINGKAYVKKGDKVYEVGGGGTDFLFADSVEELPDPSTVPEDTVALVPSEENVIDLAAWGIDVVTPALSGGGMFDADIDHEAFWNGVNKESVLKITLEAGDEIIMPMSSYASFGGVIGACSSSSMIYTQGVMLKINLQIMAGYDASGAIVSTTIVVLTEQLTIPS